MKNNWNEVRKECELDQDGNYVIKKVILEKLIPTKSKIEKRVIIENVIRIIGIISIFIPLFLFYKQQKAEQQKQDRLQKINIYSSMIVDLHSFSTETPFSQEYKNKSNKILFESYPKILFLNDKVIVNQFKDLKLIIEYTNFLNEIFNRSAKADSLTSYFSLVDNLNFAKYNNKYAYSQLPEDFRFFKSQKEKLLYYSNHKQSKNIKLINQWTKQIDTLLTKNIDALYYLQDKNYRDSIVAAGNFLYFQEPPLLRTILIDKYKNDYKVFLSKKLTIIDSLMIESSKMK